MPAAFDEGPLLRCPPVPEGGCPSLPLAHTEAGQALYRVCSASREILELDGRTTSDYRFSPIFEAEAAPVSVYYTALHPRAALAETVLRHRYAGSPGALYRRDLEGRQLVELRVKRSIAYVPLFGPVGQRLPYGAADAISKADAGQYARTRAWAEAVMKAHPDAEAIAWTSAQDLQYPNLMLWKRAGTPDPLDALELVGDPLPLLHPAVLGQIAGLAALTGHVLDVD